MSNKQEEARDKRKQSITTAINKLINNASTRFGYIERAMDSLPEAMLRTSKDQGDASAAKTIANKLTVKHIIEYIIHIKTARRRQ